MSVVQDKKKSIPWVEDGDLELVLMKQALVSEVHLVKGKETCWDGIAHSFNNGIFSPYKAINGPAYKKRYKKVLDRVNRKFAIDSPNGVNLSGLSENCTEIESIALKILKSIHFKEMEREELTRLQQVKQSSMLRHEDNTLLPLQNNDGFADEAHVRGDGAACAAGGSPSPSAPATAATAVTPSPPKRKRGREEPEDPFFSVMDRYMKLQEETLEFERNKLKLAMFQAGVGLNFGAV